LLLAAACGGSGSGGSWSRTIPAGISTPPLLHEGRVLLGTDDGRIFVLRAEDGGVEREIRAKGRWLRGRLAAHGTKLFAVSEQRHLEAFDLASGRLLWRRDSESLFGSPILHGATLHVGDRASILALDPESGEVRRRTEVGGAAAPVELAGSEEGLFAAAPGYGISRFDAADGSLRWNAPLPRAPSSPPIPLPGGVAILAGPLHCFSLRDGKLLWSVEEVWTPPAPGGTILVAGGRPPALWLLSPGAGTTLSAAPLPAGSGARGPLFAGPAVHSGRTCLAVDDRIFEIGGGRAVERAALPGRALFLEPGLFAATERRTLVRIGLDRD